MRPERRALPVGRQEASGSWFDTRVFNLRTQVVFIKRSNFSRRKLALLLPASARLNFFLPRTMHLPCIIYKHSGACIQPKCHPSTHPSAHHSVSVYAYKCASERKGINTKWGKTPLALYLHLLSPIFRNQSSPAEPRWQPQNGPFAKERANRQKAFHLTPFEREITKKGFDGAAFSGNSRAQYVITLFAICSHCGANGDYAIIRQLVDWGFAEFGYWALIIFLPRHVGFALLYPNAGTKFFSSVFDTYYANRISNQSHEPER